MLCSSSAVGSRVAKRSPKTSCRDAHAASSLTVNQVGQYSLWVPSVQPDSSARGEVHHAVTTSSPSTTGSTPGSTDTAKKRASNRTGTSGGATQ